MRTAPAERVKDACRFKPGLITDDGEVTNESLTFEPYRADVG
jgi:hypothetical protein